MRLWTRLKQEDMPHERPELRKRSANFVALSPVSFLHRAADFFGDRVAIVHGSRPSRIANSMPARSGSHTP
jgi:hypothetical protein